MPEARGRGGASEILGQLTRWAFDELDARRITLLIDVDYPASLADAEQVGFVREGVMRSLHLEQERRGDAVILSKLASDPLPAGQRQLGQVALAHAEAANAPAS